MLHVGVDAAKNVAVDEKCSGSVEGNCNVVRLARADFYSVIQVGCDGEAMRLRKVVVSNVKRNCGSVLYVHNRPGF